MEKSFLSLAIPLFAMVLLLGCTSGGEATVEPTAVVTAEVTVEQTATPEPTDVMEKIVSSVEVSDQEVSDASVVVDKVVAAEAGWLVIHIYVGGAPGAVLGFTQVSKGENENVVVDLAVIQFTGELSAMLHVDHGEEGIYEFPGEDAPATEEENVVNVPFQAS